MSKEKRMNRVRMSKQHKKQNNGRTKPIIPGFNYRFGKPQEVPFKQAERFMRQDSDRTLLPRFRQCG